MTIPAEVAQSMRRSGLAYGAYGVGVAMIAGTITWIANTVPYLPQPWDFSAVDLRLPEAAIVLTAFALATAALAYRVRSAPAVLGGLIDAAAAKPLLSIGLLATAAVAAAMLIARFVLDAFPNSDDEYAVLVQAGSYAHGRLWEAAPPAPAFFEKWRVLIKDGKWVGQYAPAWPALLAAASHLGLSSWTVNPMVAGATIVSFAALARRTLTPRMVPIVVVCLVTSAFFLFTVASFFNHGWVALAAILFALAARAFLNGAGAGAGLVAGLALGVIGLTRPADPVIFALPFLVQLVAARSRRLWRQTLWIGIGALPCLVLLLVFFNAVTGNPLLPVPNWFGAEPEHLVLPGRHALKLMIWRLWLLAIWTSPILVIAIPVGLLLVARRHRLDFHDFYPPIILVFFLFYPGAGGNQYGPRYYYEALPFALLTVFKAVDALVARNDAARRWCLHLIAAHLIVQAVVLPFRCFTEHRIVFERQDIYRQVARAGLDRAVVLIATYTGRHRLMHPKDLVRTTLDGPVIYALDLPGQTEQLRQVFADRSFYRYRLAPAATEGVLEPVLPSAE